MQFSFYNRFIIIVLLIFNASILFAATINPDSLERQIPQSSDTVRIQIYTQLFQYYSDTDPERAIKYLDRGIEFARQQEYPEGEVLLYRSYGQYYHRQGDTKQAFDYYSKAIELSRKLKNKSAEAITRVNLGALYLDQAWYQKASVQLLIAYRLFDLLPENKILKEKSVCLLNLGLLNYYQKHYAKAREYYQKSMALKLKSNDKRGIALLYNNLGNVDVEEHKNATAFQNFKKSLQMYIEIGNKRGIALAYNNLGSLYKESDNADSALYCYNLAYKADKEIDDKSNQAVVLFNMASIYYEKKRDINQSIYYVKLSLKNAYESGSLEDQMSGNQFYASLLYEKGAFADAYQYLNKTLDLRDSIYSIETATTISDMQVKYETEQREKEIKLLQIENMLKQSNLQRQRWIMLGIVLISILIAVVVYLFFKRYQARQFIKNQQIEHDRLELENRLLRVQMNPHFIFNSLNSIQNFVAHNETGSAEIYLAKFASLIRSILQSSVQSIISLEEEIKILRLYLELEKLRFNNKFDFNIHIEDSVDEEFMEVPPMLIQPFVENSIKHGIAHRQDDKGLIYIDIRYVDKFLYCTVTDNGVGRKKASELKQHVPGYKSMGMQLTSDRLKLLKQQLNLDIRVDFEDLYDENQNAIGTKVNIRIPCSEID
jgi:tetratricopeptide (TPR) repeat protein